MGEAASVRTYGVGETSKCEWLQTMIHPTMKYHLVLQGNDLSSHVK